MKPNIIRAVILLLILSAAAPAARKASEDPADEGFRFGLSLFDEKDYGRAVTEFKRYRFLRPDSPKAEEALRRAATACFLDKKWAAAEKCLRDYVKAYSSASWDEQAEFYLPESLFQQVQTGTRAELARTFKPGTAAEKQDLKAADRAQADELRRQEARQRYYEFTQKRTASPMYNLALARLASLELLDHHWMEAGDLFDKLGASPLKDAYQSRAPELARESRGGADLGGKSKVLAVLASAVLPGSGQAYAGYWRQGLFNFTAVGGMAGWSAWLYGQNQNTSALVVAVVGGIFYLGNLSSAARDADLANDEQPRQRIRKIFEDIERVPAPQPEALLPLVRFSFR